MINTFSSAGSDDRCHISSPCRVGREKTGAKSPTPTDGGCMVRPVGTATSREKRVRPRVRSISAPSRGPSRCATRWRRAYAAPVESAVALTADSDDDEETLERSTPQLFTTSRHALCDTFDRTSRLCPCTLAQAHARPRPRVAPLPQLIVVPGAAIAATSTRARKSSSALRSCHSSRQRRAQLAPPS